MELGVYKFFPHSPISVADLAKLRSEVDGGVADIFKVVGTLLDSHQMVMDQSFKLWSLLFYFLVGDGV